MLWLILLVAVFLLLVVFPLVLDNHVAFDAEVIAMPASLICTVLSVLLIIVSVIVSFGVLSNNEMLQKLDDDIVVLQKRYDNQKLIVNDIVDKYPLEERMLKSFNPVILLALPEIKSDVVISEQLKLLLSIQDDIYQCELDKNKIRKGLRVCSNRWIVPTLVKPRLDD